MKYINKITGAVIDVKSKVTGINWEPIEEAKKASPRKKTEKVSEE